MSTDTAIEAPPKCHALTRKGTQCTHNANPGAEFCTTHLEKQPYGVISTNGNGNGSPAPPPKATGPTPEELRDNKILAQAQAILDGQPVPEGWMADEATVQPSGKHRISYEAYNGSRMSVSAVEFMRMQRGFEPWPRPQVSESNIEEAVQLLTGLSFLKCSICRLPLGPDGRRLYDMCYAVVKTEGMRLPRSQKQAERTPRGGKKIVTFPGMHKNCSAGEELIAELVVAGKTSDNAALTIALEPLVEKLQEKLEKQNPDATRNEAISTLQNMYRAITQKEVA